MTTTMTNRRRRLYYKKEDDIAPEPITSVPRIDTSFLEPHNEALAQWLGSLQQVERSPPLWVGTNLVRLSPSEALQDCLDSMQQLDGIALFSERDDPATKYKFDWAWRYALIKLLSQQTEWNEMVSKQGMSNTHPLRLQVVAIPAHTSLPAHVHPAVELDIPLLGTLYEERAPPNASNSNSDSNSPPYNDDNSVLLVDPDLIDRAPEHSLGTPLSDFSPQPTASELQAIGQDLTQRVSQEHSLDEFSRHWREENIVSAGQCLVNKVGSVHRSYTRDDACLLFVLGPNVHAHFDEFE